MSDTKIEWTEKSWNPVTGCSKVSDGCLHCYAETMAKRLRAMGVAKYADGFAVRCHPECLSEPLHWRKPRRIFVNSMSDIFHPQVPQAFRTEVFDIMCSWRWPSKAAQREGDTEDLVDPGHTFQILTKRPENITPWLEWVDEFCPGDSAFQVVFDNPFGGPPRIPKHIHLGVTVENQQAAAERIPRLLDTPAAVRFISVEPMLSPIDLRKYYEDMKISWVIVGAETGPGRRPCKLEWVRDIITQCDDANVPIFIKQLSINGKVSKDPAEWPEWARRREYPKAKA